MRLQIRLEGALLLTGALLLSGCGLKYDLYLPEDENNIQAISAAQDEQNAQNEQTAVPVQSETSKSM